MNIHANPFTAAIVRYMLSQPETKETCILWMHEAGMDRHKAAVEMAGQLGKDIAEHFNFDESDPTSKLIHDLVEAALFNVNFFRAAKALLDKFCPLKYRPLTTPSLN